jgi:hypothetical protein
MARETINIGVVANDGTGDTFRIAGQKINDNFEELYTNFAATELGDGIDLDGNNIVGTRSNDNINFIPSGTGIVTMPNLLVDGTINLVDNVISATQSNSDLVMRSSGTGSIVLGDISIQDNTVSTNASNADTELTANGTGTISLLSNATINGDMTVTSVSQGAGQFDTSVTLASGATVTSILDQDNMSGNSATALATQQSIKAYVDSQVTAQDLDFTADDLTTNSIDLDSETLQLTGGAGIDTSATGNTVTFSIDSSVVTLTGSQALSNKTLTSPIVNNINATGSWSMTQLETESLRIKDNTITTSASNADLEMSAAGTGKVTINGLALPRDDNGTVQAVKTDGAGTLSFVNVDYLYNNTVLEDGSVTLASSATANIDTFDSTVYRSTRYVMSISDSTNSRYEIVEAIVTHDGSTAYVSKYGSTTNHTSSLLTLTADVSGSDVRLRVVPISSDSTVIKFLARRQAI